MFSRATIIAFIACSAIAFFPDPTQAAGVGVSPHKLDVEVQASSSTSGFINVINNSDEELIYVVYVEEEDLSEWFSITPQEFTLEPGRYREVHLDISPPGKTSGDYQTDVCIVGLVHNSELRIGCGVKVPVNIHVLPAGLPGRIASALPGNLSFTSFLAIIGFVAVPSLTVLYFKRRRRKIAVQLYAENYKND
ncbi:MAG: hypothetical protein PHY18_04655 [Dehalococcoidales bacterium]|nr:hypothetical protein [Dehalococcoidales bacterium]